MCVILWSRNFVKALILFAFMKQTNLVTVRIISEILNFIVGKFKKATLTKTLKNK